MLKYVIFFFINCHIFYAGGTKYNCSSNEIFKSCLNIRCQATCALPKPLENICKPPCEPGCACINGYLRNDKGVCVKRANCTKCDENEEYKMICYKDCENTCAEPNLSNVCLRIFPRSGCICKTGYLRNDDGQCVKPANCKRGCGGDPNAYFDECGDPVPITCNNMLSPPSSEGQCISDGGCKCKQGYVRDFMGACIKPEKCVKCGVNEIYTSGCALDTLCSTLDEPCYKKTLIPFCRCKEGFARNKNICIPREQCPPKSPDMHVKYPEIRGRKHPIIIF